MHLLHLALSALLHSFGTKMQFPLCRSARSAMCKRCKVVVLFLYFLILALL